VDDSQIQVLLSGRSHALYEAQAPPEDKLNRVTAESQSGFRPVVGDGIIGLGGSLAIVSAAAFGLLGAAGAMIAAVLHNLSMLLVLANAGSFARRFSAG
jgi:cation transport ATPase